MREIAAVVAAHLDYEWEEILLDEDVEPSLGTSPWDTARPIILDTTAATELGYAPVGDYATTVIDEIDWLVSGASHGRPFMSPLDAFFSRYVNYDSEDRYLSRLPGFG